MNHRDLQTKVRTNLKTSQSAREARAEAKRRCEMVRVSFNQNLVWLIPKDRDVIWVIENANAKRDFI